VYFVNSTVDLYINFVYLVIMLAMTDKIKEAVRVELARRDMSQVELAKKIERTPQQVNNVIRGESAKLPEVWEDILNALGLELTVVPKAPDKPQPKRKK
jgi:ribosome-binding protein aMBF1 (putative translation factor)